MKIGILTFQYALNYGAVLQMYGLKETLDNLGYEVEIINYIPDGFSYKDVKFNLRNAGLTKRNLLSVSKFPMILKKFKKTITNQSNLIKEFSEFLNENFKLSNRIINDNWIDIKGNYDVIIVGSDQVWNPTNQKGDIYFLNSDLKCKKISYAADSTSNHVDFDLIEKLKIALNDFRAISVRNQHTQAFVEHITGHKVRIVPDPVVLHDFNNLVKLMSPKQKYALIYILGKEISGGHDLVVKAIRAKYGDIKIIQVVMINQLNYLILETADEKLYDCAPDQWLNLIYNAEMIYTDSFHATLFSIKFHRNFICYYSDGHRAPRLIALQRQYNLGSKIISSYDDMINNCSLDENLNYERIDEILEKERQEGIDFLVSNLKGNTSNYE